MRDQEHAKEIFTPNYDLIIEKSLEDNGAPYFDGFVGGYEPFFLHDSIGTTVSGKDMTRNWIRVWKMHGSLSWFWKKDSANKHIKIIRSGKVSDIDSASDELVIYPSREKYVASQKQPFIAYFDRLKAFLCSGELLFIISGYSFSDDHINEVIFSSLRQNRRLTMIVFMFTDAEVERLSAMTSSYLNLIVYGPQKGVSSGSIHDWEYDVKELKPKESSAEYWDEGKKRCFQTQLQWKSHKRWRNLQEGCW